MPGAAQSLPLLDINGTVPAIGWAVEAGRSDAIGFLRKVQTGHATEGTGSMSDARTAEEEPGLPAPGADSSAHPTEALSLGVGLICLILIGINLRPAIVSVGPLLPSIRQAFGLSHTEASLLTAIPDVLMGVLALPTPWLSRRYGRDRVILAALILLLLATLAPAFAGSLATLLASTVAVGAGLAIAGALVGGFIKAAYTRRAAFVTGVYAAALALGSTIAAAASSPLALARSFHCERGVL